MDNLKNYNQMNIFESFPLGKASLKNKNFIYPETESQNDSIILVYNILAFIY